MLRFIVFLEMNFSEEYQCTLRSSNTDLATSSTGIIHGACGLGINLNERLLIIDTRYFLIQHKNSATVIEVIV